MSNNFLVYALNYLFYALAVEQLKDIMLTKGLDAIFLMVVLGRVLVAVLAKVLKVLK